MKRFLPAVLALAFSFPVLAETNAPVVTLNSGYTMPTLGFGTWTLTDKQAEDCKGAC